MVRKTLYLLVFLFSILGKDIASVGLNIWYWNNKAEITRKYCENKSRPMLHCDGKCYLAKRLARIAFQEYQKENQKNKPVKPSKTVLFSEAIVFALYEYGLATDPEKVIFREVRLHVSPKYSEIFHPPCV